MREGDAAARGHGQATREPSDVVLQRAQLLLELRATRPGRHVLCEARQRRVQVQGAGAETLGD